MKWQILELFVTASLCAAVGNNPEKCPVGVLDNIIIKILESLRPQLANLTIGFQEYETGQQEFGNFRGHLNDVTVKGVDKFQIKILQTSILDVKNLTIVTEKIEARGMYKIDGGLVFPMGKTDIHFFGDGFFRAELSDFSLSFKIKLKTEEGMNVVKDFDVIIELKKMNVHLTNLMGGGDLEKIFNILLNDIGLTVFNYYKEPILEEIKPKIKKIITEILNKKDNE